MQIEDDDVQTIGQLADQCDNLLAAMDLPLPAHIHMEGIQHGLLEISSTIKEIVVRVTGENPWEHH